MPTSASRNRILCVRRRPPREASDVGNALNHSKGSRDVRARGALVVSGNFSAQTDGVRTIVRSIWTALPILGVLVALQGCVATGVTVLGIGAGVSANAVTDYTINGTARRTFTASSEAVYQATRSALKQMGMTVKTDRRTDEGRVLTARAGDREVEIELLALTTKATQMRVTVKQGMFWRDRATAGEFIAQTNGELKNGRQKSEPVKNGELKSSTPGDGHLNNSDGQNGARTNGERRNRESRSYEDVGLSP